MASLIVGLCSLRVVLFALMPITSSFEVFYFAIRFFIVFNAISITLFYCPIISITNGIPVSTPISIPSVPIS